jgi:DNA/RNA-binding domain of Phe-tRNA-synthetase-like protein
VSDTARADKIADLLRRHHEALAQINKSLADNDPAQVKAWRSAFKRINLDLFNAGYRFDEQGK